MTTQTKWYVDEGQFRYTLDVIAGPIQITVWGTEALAQEAAQLCAAAPDLLQACEALLPIIKDKANRGECVHDLGWPGWKALLTELQVALAKAKGEQ